MSISARIESRVARSTSAVGKFDAFGLGLRLDLRAERFAGSVQSLSSAAVRSLRSGRGQSDRRQDGPRAFSVDIAGIVLQALKERLPFGVDRFRIGFVARVKVFDVRGIAAVQKRSEGKSGVRVLARHRRDPELGVWELTADPTSTQQYRISPARRGAIPFTLFNALDTASERHKE